MEKSVCVYHCKFDQRRHINVTTLNNTDYQHNSFFITILSTIPDIWIEFLMNWKRNEGVADEEFKTLQKNTKLK